MFAAVVAKIMPQTGTRGVVVNNRMKCQVGQDHTCAKLKGHANPKIHVFLIFCKKWRRKRSCPIRLISGENLKFHFYFHLIIIHFSILKEL